ncbi:unnamed protein product [Closterium sp. NIES-53]
MASLRVRAFYHEGGPVPFDTWLDNLQLYLLIDSKDSVSLLDLVSGAATAPPATADSSTRSQWLTRNAATRLAIHNHLPLAECAHFGQHRTAQALYDAIVACYSSPAIAALGRLLLPYLFPELSAFTTVEDLVSHLRASDAHYRAAVPAEFLDRNPPPMDHFLSIDSTSLPVDLLEQHLLTAETCAVAVGAARGTPRLPFFEGCSPSPLAPSYASAAAADVSVPEDVGAASASVKRRSSKGKGGWSGGGGSGGGGGGSGSGSGGSSGGGGGGGTVGGSGGSGGGGGGSSGGGGSGGGGTGSGGTGAWSVSSGGGQRQQQQQRRSETPSPQQLHLLKSRIAIFDLDFDAILSAMYALSVSAEGDCYRCVPLDSGIAAAALGASESCTLPASAPAEALHTFTLDSGASRCFFRDSTTLTPLPAPVPVRLADPSRGPVVACSSTVLSCLAVPSGSLSGLHLPSFSTNLVSTAALQDAMVTTTTPGGQRVSICTCTRTGRHLATFTRRPGSSLYTLTTEPSQALLWQHCLGHPSLPRLRGMHSRLLVSGLLRSLPSLPPSPAPPCLPCVEGRQRAAPHSSSFPPTTAPLQTLHMDVKGQVVDVLISWIRTVRLQLRERFGQDLPVLRLHSDRGGEFSSDLLRDFYRGEGILQSFTLPDSPQQNGSRSHLHDPCGRSPFSVAVCGSGSRAFVCDTSADKLSPRAIPCVFLGFVPDAPGWQFYHPTSRRVFPSQDLTIDESVPFYRLFPYRSSPPPPPPLFLAPGPPPVDPLPPQGPAPSSVSQVDPLPGPAPVHVAVDSGAARGAASGGAEPVGADSEGAETGGAELGGVMTGGGEPGGAEPEGVEPEGVASEGAEPQGAASSGGSAGAGAARAGGPRVAAGAGVTGGTATTGPGGARTRGTCAGGAGAGGTGAAEVGAVDPGVGGFGDTPASPLPAPSPYIEQSGGLTKRREPASRSVSPVRTSRRVPCSRPPSVPGTHAMSLHPSTVPLRVPLPPPPESSLPEVPEIESDRARAASPTVSRLFANAVIDPSFESTAASALVAELLDFAATCRLDYASALVSESKSASLLSVGGECALSTDVLEDKQEDFESLAAAVPRFASMLLAPEGDPDAPDIPTPRSYAEAIMGPYFSQWQAAMDAEMASWKSTGT